LHPILRTLRAFDSIPFYKLHTSILRLPILQTSYEHLTTSHFTTFIRAFYDFPFYKLHTSILRLPILQTSYEHFTTSHFTNFIRAFLQLFTIQIAIRNINLSLFSKKNNQIFSEEINQNLHKKNYFSLFQAYR
jgi:hypothetical protein